MPDSNKTYDQDGDGRLGYEDMKWLSKTLSQEQDEMDFPEEQFDVMCEQVGATDKLMTKDQLVEILGDGVQTIWYQLRALRKQVW